MAEFIAIVFLILLFVAIGAIVRFFWRIFVGLMRMGTPPTNQQQVQVRVVKADRGMTAEEEGNVHSGPYGYSPNTAYPETQYGSLFNPDAEWNHEEH
jgi:hypothetical protein